MPDQWAMSTAKTFIRAWLTARDRIITAGHELIETVEDLVEEVRHERAVEAQRPPRPRRLVPAELGRLLLPAPRAREPGLDGHGPPRRSGRSRRRLTRPWR